MRALARGAVRAARRPPVGGEAQLFSPPRARIQRLSIRRREQHCALKWGVGLWSMARYKASAGQNYQRHHRSPSLSPGKEYIGIGVERSLPRDLLNLRKLSSTC
jgi:hypothetical protein